MLGRSALCLATLLALWAIEIQASDGQKPESDVTKEPWDSKVRVVEYDGFWRFIDRHPLVLMEFYAPWLVLYIQHCPCSVL